MTRDDILNVINELVAEGKKPTMNAIRGILGGSNSTILPVLREWKSEKKFKLSKQSQKILNDFSEKFTLSILDEGEGDKDFVHELSVKSDQLNMAEEKIKSLEDNSMKLQWALDNAHENLVEKKEDIGLLNSSMNNLSTENGKLQVKVKTLLKQVASLEQAALLDNILESTDVATPGL